MALDPAVLSAIVCERTRLRQADLMSVLYGAQLLKVDEAVKRYRALRSALFGDMFKLTYRSSCPIRLGLSLFSTASGKRGEKNTLPLSPFQYQDRVETVS